MENTNETMSPIEPIEETEKEEEYPKTLCGVIPVTFERFGINPYAVDWENWSADTVFENRMELLILRHKMLTATNADMLQRCMDLVVQKCDDYINITFERNIDTYIERMRQINEFKVCQYPVHMPYLIMLNDTITIHDWMEKHLRIYQTLREIHTAEECFSILRDIIFAGETYDPTTDVDEEEDEDEASNEQWDGSDELQAEMIRENIINDNNEFINNPDNMTDDDLRSIINSFNDDHSVSGLLDD